MQEPSFSYRYGVRQEVGDSWYFDGPLGQRGKVAYKCIPLTIQPWFSNWRVTITTSKFNFDYMNRAINVILTIGRSSQKANLNAVAGVGGGEAVSSCNNYVFSSNPCREAAAGRGG